jgi:hypothetical protein
MNHRVVCPSPLEAQPQIGRSGRSAECREADQVGELLHAESRAVDDDLIVPGIVEMPREKLPDEVALLSIHPPHPPVSLRKPDSAFDGERAGASRLVTGQEDANAAHALAEQG